MDFPIAQIHYVSFMLSEKAGIETHKMILGD